MPEFKELLLSLFTISICHVQVQLSTAASSRRRRYSTLPICDTISASAAAAHATPMEGSTAITCANKIHGCYRLLSAHDYHTTTACYAKTFLPNHAVVSAWHILRRGWGRRRSGANRCATESNSKSTAIPISCREIQGKSKGSIAINLWFYYSINRSMMISRCCLVSNIFLFCIGLQLFPQSVFLHACFT